MITIKDIKEQIKNECKEIKTDIGYILPFSNEDLQDIVSEKIKLILEEIKKEDEEIMDKFESMENITAYKEDAYIGYIQRQQELEEKIKEVRGE